MSFTHRPLQVKDLETCFSIVVGKEIYEGPVRAELLSFWKFLVEKEACVSTVIEDDRLPKGKRQVSFGLSAFVTNDFMQRAKTRLPPFLVPQILKDWGGNNRAFLLKHEIEQKSANEGLNLFALHYGWDTSRLTTDEAFRVRSLLQECFLSYHSGYRINEIIHEALGVEIRGLMEAAGEKLRRDYREFRSDPLLQRISSQIRPFLVGCTKEEACKQPGSFMALMWSRFYPPRLGFNEGEKKALELALKGETDEDMAKSLHIALDTVKKRWQNIYDKVLKADLELLTDPAKPKAKDSRTRQRRRYLLDYLRNHPEELRPYEPAPKKKAGVRKPAGKPNH